MAKTNDTIEGLLAEFRGYSAGMPPSYHVTMSWHDFRQMLDRLEAAHKREKAAIEADALAVGGIVGASHRRELSKNVSKNGADFGQLGDAAKLREAITPNSDPDWKAICAKCKDGDIEPKHCEYYGEPNGCNSPIYGEHPTAEKSSVVGNASKLRGALKAARVAINAAKKKMGVDNPVILEIIDAALAAPPRNCDVGTAEEQAQRLHRFCISQDCATCPCNLGKADGRCEFVWMQRPYKEGGNK